MVSITIFSLLRTRLRYLGLIHIVNRNHAAIVIHKATHFAGHLIDLGQLDKLLLLALAVRILRDIELT